jgi:hypothetical protein
MSARPVMPARRERGMGGWKLTANSLQTFSNR